MAQLNILTLVVICKDVQKMSQDKPQKVLCVLVMLDVLLELLNKV